MNPGTASSGSSSEWEALKDQGNQAFKANALEKAIGFYSKAIAVNPEEATLFSNRSAAYLKQSNYELAAADARRATELDETFAKAYSRLHNALCNLGRFDEAADVLKKGVALVSASPNASPQDIKHLTELQASAQRTARAMESAQKLVDSKDLQGAARLLNAPVRAFPGCTKLAFLYAVAQAPTAPEEANKVLMHFTHTHSEDVHYLYLRALVLYYRGQDCFKNAQLILRQVLESDPDNTQARVLLKKIRSVEGKKEAGNTAFKQKRFKEAVEEYTEAIDLDPTNTRMTATLRGNRAAAKMDLRDYTGALLDCDFAINNGLTSAKMYARRSRIHENLEKYDDAVRDLQQAAEEDRRFEGELRQLKMRAKRANRKNYYKALSLPQNESDQNVIKRAYKKACLQWHPDKWGHASEEEQRHAEAQFKEVGEAYGVLSDPQKKRLYDSGQMDNDVEGANPGAGGFGQASNDDLANMMNMMFGGGAQFTTGGFSTFGGGGGGGFRGRRQRSGVPPGFFQL